VQAEVRPAEEAIMQPDPTPFVVDEERSLVRDALIGIVLGMIAFALITFVVVLVAWPDQSVGFAAAVAVFTGPWAGLFFGSAGGVAYSQWQAAKALATSHAAPPESAPTVPPTVAFRH
jgi:hypothetical protein